MSCTLYSKPSYAHLVQSQLLHNAFEQVTGKLATQAEILNWFFSLNVAAYAARYSDAETAEDLLAAEWDDTADYEFSEVSEAELEDPDKLGALLSRISYQCSDVRLDASQIEQNRAYDQLEAIRKAVKDSEAPAERAARLKIIEDRKKAEHQAAYEQALAELREAYPWATPSSSKLSGPARAAKNLKKELAIAFPGFKFSVTSSRYSGGNSINVSWVDGPSSDAVDAICSKYKAGSFDGSTDSYDYDHSPIGEAVDVVLGRTRHLSTGRHYSRAALETAVEWYNATYAAKCAAQVKGEDGAAYLEYDNSGNFDACSREIYALLKATDLRI